MRHRGQRLCGRSERSEASISGIAGDWVMDRHPNGDTSDVLVLRTLRCEYLCRFVIGSHCFAGQLKHPADSAR
jgi:hypothetical protein